MDRQKVIIIGTGAMVPCLMHRYLVDRFISAGVDVEVLTLESYQPQRSTPVNYKIDHRWLAEIEDINIKSDGIPPKNFCHTNPPEVKKHRNRPDKITIARRKKRKK